MLEPYRDEDITDDSIPLEFECPCGDVVTVTDENAMQLECPACGTSPIGNA